MKKGRVVLILNMMMSGVLKCFSVVKKGIEYYLIDTLGNIIDPEVTSYNYLKMDEETGLIWFTKDSKYGLLNNKGQIVVDNIYNYTGSFSEGLAKVRIQDGYSYINTEGDLVSDLKYDYAYDFSGGLGGVQVGNKFGFVNKRGVLVIDAEYDLIEQFRKGYAVVQTRSVNSSAVDYMVIDRWGRVIFSGYKNIERMKSGFLGQKADNSYEIMDYDENIIKITKPYAQMASFNQDFDLLAGVFFTEENMVIADLLNNKGEIILGDITREEDYSFEEDLYNQNAYLVKENDDKTILEKIAPVRETITCEAYHVMDIFGDNLVVKKGYDPEVGVIDMDGNTIIDFEYNMIQLTPDGYAIVMKNSKSGILDLAGNVILPIEYDYIYKPKDTLEY